MVLAAFSGVVLPEARSALASLKTRPVSGPSSWSMAIWHPLRLVDFLRDRFRNGSSIASAVPLTAGINSPGAASLVWVSLPNQTFMKSIVSLGASFVTSHPSKLANRSLALPLPPLTSGKKTQPSFSLGSPFLSAAFGPTVNQIPGTH